MALDKIIVSIPVSDGLDTKTDSKQVMAGKALVLENVRFQKTGKLSKRYALLALTNTAESGNLSDHSIRGIVSDDSQINAVTDNGIYSLYDRESVWAKTSDFATSALVQSEFSSKTSKDNYFSDVDYDDTSKMLVTSFFQLGDTSNSLGIVIKDTQTSQKKTIRLSTNTVGSMPRVIVTTYLGEVRVFVFYTDGTGLLVLNVFDKNLDILSSSTILNPAGTFNYQTDACKDGSNVYFVYQRTTNLNAFKYDNNGTLVLSNTVSGLGSIVLKSGIPTGLSVCESGLNLHVAYPNSALSTIQLVGVSKNALTQSIPSSTQFLAAEAIGIVADASNVYITASFLNSSPSEYRSSLFTVPYTSSYGSGSGISLARLSVLAKPFILNSKVYAVLNCNESHQLTGFVADFNGRPVVNISPFQVLRNQAYTGASPENYSCSKSVVGINQAFFSFERNFRGGTNDTQGDFISTRGSTVTRFYIPEAHKTGTRCKVGESIYYTSGLTLEMDARSPHENNFLLSPNIISVSTSGTGGSLPAGVYNYVAIYEFYDGKGQITRSGRSQIVSVTTTGSSSINTITFNNPVLSYKGSINSALTDENIRSSTVVYRTEVGGSVFYRVKSIDNFTNTGSNNSVTDTVLDSSIINNEAIYTTGDVLENNPIPVAAFSASGGNRLFVGGLEEKDEIGYTFEQLFGESLASNGFYRIRIATGTSADNSDISAIGYMDGKIIIFRSGTIYYVAGDGPLRTGLQDTFTPPTTISTDSGCESPRSVLVTPDGLIFKSLKGIYLLSRSFQVSYIGSPVEAYNGENIVSSILMDRLNEARFYTDAGNCLVYNYVFGTWSVFRDQTPIDASLWRGDPVSIKLNRVYREEAGQFQGTDGYYSMKFTSPWLKLNSLQGYQRCYQLWILGEYKSPHTLKCRVYTDYDDSVYDDYDLVYNNTQSPQYQFQISIPRQKVESIKFEIYDTNQSASGESFELSGIQCEVGLKSGGYKLGNTKSY